MKRQILFILLHALSVFCISAYAAKSDVIAYNTAGAIVSFSSSGTYEWEWYSSGSKLRSTNYQVNSSTSQSTITISTSSSCTFSFDYAVSSESNYDKLTITLDGSTIVNAISGTASNSYNGTLSSGSHSLVLKYVKDGSQSTGDDRAYVSNMKFLSSGSSSTNPSGNCGISGSNVTWSYNASTCVLTISGSGQMANYDANMNTPWDSYRDDIKTVNIGSGVTSIGDYAFGYLYALTSVSIPSTVTKIGKGAFEVSQKLSSVTIPSSVTTIGEEAFFLCNSLSTITIPNSVTTIGKSAFSTCEYLRTISIGSGVGSIGDGAFSGCKNSSTITVNSANITFEVSNEVLINKSTSTALFIPYRKNDGVIIPEGVTTLAENLFNSHKYITSITLPSTLTTINGYSDSWFTDCNNLTAINVNTNANSYNAKFVSKDGVLYSNFGSDLYLVKCPVKKSGSITIPSRTVNIYSDAFKGCTSLTSMTVIPSTPPTVDEAYQSPAFASLISSGTKVVVKENLLNTYKSADKWSTITNWDVIPSSFVVDGIKYYTDYSDPSKVTVNPLDNNEKYSGDLVIPSTVTYQGVTYNVTSINWSYAFTDSPDLRSITFPASIEISSPPYYNDFRGCTSLTAINAIGENDNYFTFDGVFYSVNTWQNTISIAVCPPGKVGEVTIKSDVTNFRYNGFPFTNCSKVTAFKLSGESELWAEEDGVIYSKDKTKVIMCPPGKASVSLPETVTNVYSYAFYNNRVLKSIVLPDGVTNIGSYAFYNCSNLESINTPSALTTIGQNAFYGCNKLKTIPLPEGTTSIPDYAYQGMSGLTNFVVPSTVTSIGKYAFSNCPNLESITIPEGVTSIGESCFSGCTSLKAIIIPNGVTIINNSVFSGCKSLESLNLPSGVTSIGNSAFYNCESLKEINVPSGVTSIGSSAFSGSKDLNAISLPSGISKISEYTFSGCSSLKNVSIPTAVTQIGNSAFNSCQSLTDIVIPSSVTSLGTSVFSSCSNLESVNIQAAITAIPDQSFYGCSKLKSFNIPETVKTIGSYAFYNCNLSNIIVPSSVTTIESYAFQNNVKLYDVYNLSNLTITKGATDNGYVGYYAMAIHSSLGEPSVVSEQGDFLFATINARPTLVGYKGNNTEIVLPESYNGAHYDIGANTFYKTSVTSLTMSLAVDSICSGAFNSSNLQKVDVKDLTWWCSAVDKFASNPLSVANHLYLNGEEIIDLVIPSDVSYIGNSAFTYCLSIESVTVPSSVKKIGKNAFYNCKINRLNISDLNSWLNIDFGSTYTYPHPFCSGSGGDLYVDGKPVTDLVIPDGIAEIPQFAFYGCKNIRSVVLPASISSIGNYAFRECSALWEVYNLTSLDIKEGESDKNGYVGYYAKAIYNTLDAERQIQENNGFIFDISNVVPELIGYNGTQKDIVLPNKYNGSDYNIGKDAFLDNTLITSVVVPDCVSSIGNYAFGGCSNLRSVSLTEVVENIGSYAFASCTNLGSFNLPKNLKAISNGMFSGCKLLTEIVIPEGVTSIERSAFSSCTHLRDVHLPSTLISIRNFAFEGCYGIKSIVIPANVTTIEDYAFGFGSDECISEIYNLSGVSIKKGSGLARNAVAVHTSLEEPSIIEKQDGFMFVDRSANMTGSYYIIGYEGEDTNIVLPYSYKGQTYDLYCYALCGSPDITSITSSFTTPIGTNYSNVFYSISSDIPVFVPAEAVEKYKNASGWKEFKNIGSLESRITSITLSDTNKQIKIGDTYTLSATLSPEEPLISTLIWTSSDESIAIVDNGGVVTGVSVGTATITATTLDGTNLSTSCEVLVSDEKVENIPDTDIAAINNIIYVDNMEVNAGNDVVLSVKLKNSTLDVTAFSFNLVLPEGFVVKSVARGLRLKAMNDDDEYIFTFANANKNGVRYVHAYTMEDVVLSGKDGEIVKITITMPEDVKAGNYPIVITEGEISYYSSYELNDIVKSTLTVKDYIVGDANGDGRISITDVSAIAGYLLGKPGTDFKANAADANRDGRISITDVSTITGVLLGK